MIYFAALERRKWLRSISSVSTRSFAPNGSPRFWSGRSLDGSTCRASSRLCTQLESCCPNLWAPAGLCHGTPTFSSSWCSGIYFYFSSFAKVLASLFEPTETNRGQVLPSEQEHDYAAHNEALPLAWGWFGQKLGRKSKKLVCFYHIFNDRNATRLFLPDAGVFNLFYPQSNGKFK